MKAALPFLAASLFAAGWAIAQTAGEDQQALARAKAESRLAEQRAAALEARADAETDAAQVLLSRSAAVAARVQSAEADIDAAEARIALIERLRAGQRQRLAEQQDPAVRLIAALQMMARRPPSVALVQPSSLNDVVRVRAALESMLPALRQRTAGLRAELEKGRQLRTDAAKALAALNSGKAELSAQRQQLDSLAAARKAAAGRIAGSAMAEEDRAIAMAERARDLTTLLEGMGEQARQRAILASLPGPILRPTQPTLARADPVDDMAARSPLRHYRLPVNGQIVTGLGEVSASGTRASGLTLAPRPSAQIVAPADGRIAFSGAYRSYGRIVIIDHGQGWTTLVTNLAGLDVSVGETVVAGSPLGRAGTDRPTVTVELRDGNTPVDINRFLG